MEFRDLKKYRGIADKIERKKSKIARLEAKAKATVSSLTGAPGHSGVSDKVGDGASEIIDEKANLEQLKAQHRELVEYIASIDDSDTQSAIEMYIYERRTWRRIGFILHYSESGIRYHVRTCMKQFSGNCRNKGI